MFSLIGALTVTVGLAFAVAFVFWILMATLLDHSPKRNADGLGNTIIAGWLSMFVFGGVIIFGLVQFVGLTVVR